MTARKAKASTKEAYVVTAALVQAQVSDKVLHFEKGDVLPVNVSDESLEWLKELGFVEAVEVTVEDEPDGDDTDLLK